MKKVMTFFCIWTVLIIPLGAQVLRDEVLVEKGTFQMGDDNGSNDEKPMKTIKISSFFIMKTEVTQADWSSLMSFNPSANKADNLPVENLQWIDAIEYANALSEKDGLQSCYTMMKGSATCDFMKNGWRLPTEAEWEYAAMGGSKSKGYVYSGYNSLDSIAWYKTNAGGTIHPVGTKRANELGLYDMSGNVREWCWDWYDAAYYASNPQINPLGPANGSLRVVRGGGYLDETASMRVADRSNCKPLEPKEDIGLRLVRTMPINVKNSKNLLFPLFGITLQQSTTRALAVLGQRTTAIDDDTKDYYRCYLIEGFGFWYDINGIVDSIYVTTSNKMPEHWKKLGMDWRNSYSQWMSLLSKLGWEIKITEPLHYEYMDFLGYQTLQSTTECIYISDNVKYTFRILFAFGAKTQDDPNAAYSINVNTEKVW